MKVLNDPPYSPDLSPCDFFLFPRLKKMLSGNKYTSRSSLGSGIYQYLQQIPKEDYLSAFSDWVKRLQKCVSVKGKYNVLWRFVIKICLIKRSTEVTLWQWQNFLQDPCLTESLRWIYSESLFVLMFYGPVNSLGSCQVWKVYITTCLLGRLRRLVIQRFSSKLSILSLYAILKKLDDEYQPKCVDIFLVSPYKTK